MRQDEQPGGQSTLPDEPPPLFGTWPRLYAFVLCFLALVICAMYAFTRFFS